MQILMFVPHAQIKKNGLTIETMLLCAIKVEETPLIRSEVIDVLSEGAKEQRAVMENHPQFAELLELNGSDQPALTLTHSHTQEALN